MLCASAVFVFAVLILAVYFPLAAPTSVNMPTVVISVLVQTLVAVLSSALGRTSVTAFRHTAVASLSLVTGLSSPSRNLTMSLDLPASTSPMVLYNPPVKITFLI